MKKSTKFWIVLGLLLFIWVNVLCDWYPLIVITIFLFFFFLGYIVSCIDNVLVNKEEYIPNKWNIIYQINKFIDSW